MNRANFSNHRTGLEIAIIGMSGCFPGARSIDQFWQNLRQGVESISFFSDEELEAAGINVALIKHPNYVKARGILEDIELFDASLMGYSPREAEILNPQHRLFLECAWEALESAGYNSDAYKGLIGVYAGAGFNLYLANIFSNPELLDSVGTFQVTLANDKDFLPSNVSYKLNLRGPAVTVQTACSTSLVAVHLACQALLSGSCDIALAGGAGVGTEQKAGYFYQEGGILSPDGHCRAFDALAQGTVGGNGVGIVVLRRLEDAISAGDTIYALIKGSAINNDGSLKVGFTAPSMEGQARVIRMAQIMAEVEPETITYIEAHGSGTELGDPIEVAALNRVFRSKTNKKGFCAIGSVKTNIGHLDTASGVAGLIKTALALKHKQIPPSLHFNEANPKIDFHDSAFYVNRELKSWEANGGPRRAGVSSFGIGGTNAHVILEEWEQEEESKEARGWQLLVMSAENERALDVITERLGEHLRERPEERLADVAYTLQVGRRALSHRRIIVCHDALQAQATLLSKDPRSVLSDSTHHLNRPIAFMFPGIGDHYPGMGHGLYQSEEVFRQQVDLCCQILRPQLGIDLREVIYPSLAANSEAKPDQTDRIEPARVDLRKMLRREAETEDEATRRLNRTAYAQPAVFVVEYALAQMLKSWGIEPEVMIGYSLGEYVAACLAGVFKLEDALYLVAKRAEMIEETPEGLMMAVGLGEEQALEYVGEGLWVAADNGPRLSVVAGAEREIERLESELRGIGVMCSRLGTRHAFHTKMMEEVAERYVEEVKRVELRKPQVRYISNVSGRWIREEEATDASYWGRHLREAVRYRGGIERVMEGGERILVEVGPGQALSGLAKEQGEKGSGQQTMTVATMRHNYEVGADEEALLRAVGRIWLYGGRVNWEGMNAGRGRRRIALPTYPFQRQRYWVDRQEQSDGIKTPKGIIRKNPDIKDWFYAPSWTRSLGHVNRIAGNLTDRKSCWLVFIDDLGLGLQIIERLNSEDQDVITVTAGDCFTKHGDGRFVINPGVRSDYDNLLNELISLNKLPETIIHLWNLTTKNATDKLADRFKESQKLGFYSLLYLAQALGKLVVTSRIEIQAVTSDMQEVTGDEELCPEKATLLGPCKVIPQEYPNIICRNIDVTISGSTFIDLKNLAAQIEPELIAKSSDLVVAYRGSHRWVQTFESIGVKDVKRGVSRLRVNGVYLITGGLGLIGLALCEYLAQTLQARIILTGRAAFPCEREWGQWLATHDAEDEVSRKIRRLKSVEEMGGEVLVMQADVSKEEEMKMVIEEAVGRYGGINGVIHAAGIVGDVSIRSVPETRESDYEQQLLPKVHGLYVLEKLLSEQDLDFCFLVSSLSCILGGLGFTAYTAVNLFMDAFVHKQNQASKFPWISVDWDGWRFSQAAGDNEDGKGTWAQMGLTPSEGMQVIEHVLAMEKASQIIISTGNLQSRIELWVTLESVREKKAEEKKSSLSLHARPHLQNPYVPPRNDIEERLTTIWRDLLGIAEIGIYDSFFDLGGHSLIVIQLVSRLREAFNVEAPLRRVFESPTVAELSLVIIHEQLGPAITEQDLLGPLSEIENLSDSDLQDLLAEES